MNHSPKRRPRPRRRPDPGAVRRAPQLASAALLLAWCLVRSTATATDGTWNANSIGNWSDSTKWVSGLIADGAGSTANLTFNIQTTNKTVTIDGAVASRTLGILNIGDVDNTVNYIVAATGGGTLTFDNSGSNAQLNVASTSHGDSINNTVAVLLKSSLDIANASGSAFTISGSITGNTAGTMSVTNLSGVALLGFWRRSRQCDSSM